MLLDGSYFLMAQLLDGERQVVMSMREGDEKVTNMPKRKRLCRPLIVLSSQIFVRREPLFLRKCPDGFHQDFHLPNENEY